MILGTTKDASILMFVWDIGSIAASFAPMTSDTERYYVSGLEVHGNKQTVSDDTFQDY